MDIRDECTPALPYQNQPGRCPACGAEVRPAADDVFPVGHWDGRDPATGAGRAGRSTA